MATKYWCDQCLTIRIEGPDGERTIELDQPFARIGSETGCDVLLEGEGVPKLGSYLHATDRGIFALPLENSVPSTKAVGRWLTTDAAIELGSYRIYASFRDGTPLATDDVPLDQKGSTNPRSLWSSCWWIANGGRYVACTAASRWSAGDAPAPCD